MALVRIENRPDKIDLWVVTGFGVESGLSCDRSGVEYGLSCDRSGVEYGLSCDRSGVEYGLSCDRFWGRVRVKL